ncbi:MAG: hypothetical protein IJS08_15900, partial [Victivallales bacterium]|nr:hypothetical protein [Victivallales bacterium]
GERMIVKVTGRFPVLNIDKMVREFSRRKNLVYSIDIIEHGLYRMLGLNWAASKSRTIIYAISTGFYMGNVYGRYRQIPSVYGGAEGLMRAVWDETRNQPGVYSRFKTEPRLSGVGGGEELCVAYS